MGSFKVGRTALFVNKQSGGMFTVEDVVDHPGGIFFVDSGHASASDSAGFGKNPDAPFATIDYAVAYCTANNGDVIYAMPGHAELLAAAGDLDLDVAGITLQGLGNGSDQPTVTLGTIDSVDVDIDAANVTIKNIHFVAAIEDIVAAIDVNADDFTMDGCRMTGDNTSLNALIWITDAAGTASDRITIQNCYNLDRDATNTHFIDLEGTGDGHIIQNNILLGDYGTICIGGAGVVTNVAILNNYISSAATTADSGVDLADTSTGIIANNRIAIALGGDATTGVNAIACGSLENYVVDTGDRSGVLDPAAT